MTTVLKLGGSLLTRKDRPETLDRGALSASADAVADALGRGASTATAPDDGSNGGAGGVPALDGRADLVVVHGAGSFGHHYADRHGVGVGAGTRDAAAVREIHGSMTELNAVIISHLQERGVPALPVHPLSVASRDAAADLSLPSTPIGTMLSEGFVPVLHGDGVVHAGEGVTILSGDEVVASLARGLDADRIGFCSTVPGVLDADGEVIPEVRAFDDVAADLGGSDATDVTGGMAGKVRELLELGSPAHVFGPERLAEFLGGGTPGTRIDGR